MKKLMLIMAAAFAMVACQTDINEVGVVAGGEVDVTFEVGTPTRAYSDGKTATVLQYAVYEMNDEGATLLGSLTGSKTINISTKVELQLVTGNTYTVLFWAAAPSAPYTVDWTTGTMTVNYEAAKTLCNDEKRDAFFKRHTFTVKGAQTETIELRRPFAQLNIGANDFEAAEKAGYTADKSYVKVSKLGSILNLWNDEVEGEPAVITFGDAAIPANETFPVAGNKYLAMNYLLVDSEKEVVDIEFGYTDTDENVAKVRTVGSVPVQRNHRTNIYGQLLTSDVDINVEIKPAYDEPSYEADALLLAATVGGEVTLTEDVAVNLDVKAGMILNLDGKTLTGSIDVAEGVSLVVNNGTIVNTVKTQSGIVTNGNVTLNNVNITSARHAVRVESGKVVINGGVYKVEGQPSMTQHAINIGDNGTVASVIIKGGTFIGPKVTAADSGSAVNVRSGSDVTIEGGKFTGGKRSTISGSDITIKGGAFDQNPASSHLAAGYKAIKNGDLYYVVADTVDAVATTATELQAALAAGGEVVLAGDVTYAQKIENNAVINLNGNSFLPEGTINLLNNADLTMVGGNYVANGTYGHVDVRPSTADGSVVVYENVNFAYNKLEKTYGPSTNRLGSVVEVCATATDAKTVIKFKNCTFDNAMVLFEGMSGKTGIVEAVFEGCTFNALTSSAPIQVQNYVTATIEVKNCTFNLECTSSTASAISVSSSSSTSVVLTATNNTLNAVAATPYTYDASKGETEVHNVKVNGTPANIKFISDYGYATVTETGTKKSGIAKL